MTLTHPNGEMVHLSPDLLWVDEFDWSSVAQTAPERTLSGGYIVQQGIKLKGRPISLQSPDNSMAWHTRQTVQTLQNWAMLPETTFTLTLPQSVFSVIFDNEQTAVSAQPVLGFGGTGAQDYFRLSLKFLTA